MTKNGKESNAKIQQSGSPDGSHRFPGSVSREERGRYSCLAQDLETRFGFTQGQAYVDALKIMELREINVGITDLWTAIQNLPKF
jgi:hypothetical protein